MTDDELRFKIASLQQALTHLKNTLYMPEMKTKEAYGYLVHMEFYVRDLLDELEQQPGVLAPEKEGDADAPQAPH